MRATSKRTTSTVLDICDRHGTVPNMVGIGAVGAVRSPLLEVVLGRPVARVVPDAAQHHLGCVHEPLRHPYWTLGCGGVGQGRSDHGGREGVN